MLVELRIRDFAVIEDVTLHLGPGLNVLTGETGAGKSIIVGALSLLLGERASTDVVRDGAERASVDAVFDIRGRPEVDEALEAYGFTSEDGLVILRREVAREGRNRAWVNGSPATAGAVGAVGSLLVDLHGQHEHQTLLRPAEQRKLLDAFAGAGDLAQEVARLFGSLQAARHELESREERARELAQRADFLRFQLDEIHGARVEPGEDEALEVEAKRHEHAEELIQGAGEVHDVLYGGEESVVDRLADLERRLQQLARLDAQLAPFVESLTEARVILSELGRDLGAYAASVDHDPARLAEVRARLDLIYRLKRKYGPELTDVLATAERVRAELDELDDADTGRSELMERIRILQRELGEAATRLSELRGDAARRVEAAVSETLPKLGMPGARFSVSLEPLPEVSAAGRERVEFLVATNAGFEPRPLARTASGGELSRVMLALKAVLAEVDEIPVLVFDEIDAGIGGRVAGAVGAVLAEVARRHQVFVVTHLPQVAARADTHILVEKREGAAAASATARVLDGTERVEEVARMLGGDPESETSRAHAQELLSGAAG